jgi:hypothetical protein
MPNYPVQVVYTTFNPIQDGAIVVDGAHNAYVAVQRSNQTGADVLRVYPNGAYDYLGLITPPASHGTSGVALSDDGADLVAVMTGHSWNETPRENYIGIVRLPNVLVPKGGGGSGAPPPPPPPPPPPGDDVDYDRIAREVVAKMATEMGTADTYLNKAHINGTRVAIQREGVLTEGNFHDSAAVYARLADSVWEQLTKFFGAPKPGLMQKVTGLFRRN